MTEIIQSDAEALIEDIIHVDESEDRLVIASEQDVTEIIESNKRLHNLVDERTPWGGGRRVASIPANLYWDLYRQGIVQDNKKFRAWLNDPDNRFFRTSPGVV